MASAPKIRETCWSKFSWGSASCFNLAALGGPSVSASVAAMIPTQMKSHFCSVSCRSLGLASNSEEGFQLPIHPH